MRHQKHWSFVCVFATTIALGIWAIGQEPPADSSGAPDLLDAAAIGKPPTGEAASKPSQPGSAGTSTTSGEIAPFVSKGVAWLIAAQNKNGGWGSGSMSQSHQEMIREAQKQFEKIRKNNGASELYSSADQETFDPQKVPTDPGTTAFVLLALLRAGHTPVDGVYKEQVQRGLNYLLAEVNKAPDRGPLIVDDRLPQINPGANIDTLRNITNQMGDQYTQPRVKIGPYVDTPLATQYLGRAIGILERSDPMYLQTSEALGKCLAKVQSSQQSNGSWGSNIGWAPILQSSLSCSALEIAQANGKKINRTKLDLARNFLRNRINGSSAVSAKTSRSQVDSSAGIELYAFCSAFRGNAPEARQAESALNKAKYLGRLPQDTRPTLADLKQLGYSESKARMLENAAAQNAAQIARLNDEKLVAGFGIYGGEEFVSYMLASESLVIAGGDKFKPWNDKMQARLQKLQNSDGSWSGMHCISSPVFCTAAAVQCLTTDRDADFLTSMAEKAYPGGASAKAAVAEK